MRLHVPAKSPPAPGLLDAWLLLLLRDGESYGRALVGRLRDGGTSIESHHAYRRLRALDLDGAIKSRWTASDAGPRRRSYRLAPQGRRRLAELTESITASSQLHETFLLAYQRHEEHTPTDAAREAADEFGEASPQPDGNSGGSSDDGDGGGSDARDGEGDERAAPSQEARAPAVGNQLLAAWLLLLLDTDASYGYRLRRALADHQIRADPGAMYRVLRQLERDGWLESRWMEPATGPRRRLYRLTPKGRRHLEELVTVLRAAQNSHAAFLRAYDA
jgi:PadR family transcriptional regulator, regulatory protein PadR